jgi:hypothetical protein
MKMMYDHGMWLFPIYGLALLLIMGIVLFFDPILCYFSRRRYQRSLEAARRYRSF